MNTENYTPIFDENATYSIREGEYASYKTTEDIFQQRLHSYTITHAIDDKNVLRFHIDYFKGNKNQKTIDDKWSKEWGDRIIEIVFIGQGLDKNQLTKELNECLLNETEIKDWQEKYNA